jgi:hypothetical protein
MSPSSISNKQKREKSMTSSTNSRSSIIMRSLSLFLVPLVLASAASATAPVIATTTKTEGPGNYPEVPQLHEREHQHQHKNDKRHLRYGLKERSAVSEESSEERELQTGANGERVTNFSDDGTEPKERISLDTFQIVMTPSPYELDMDGQDEFHRLAERVLFDYMSNELFRNILVYSDVELEYVLLGDLHSVRTPEDNVRHLQDTTATAATSIGGSTTLTLSSGVASFLGSGLVPSEDQVNIWVQEAIDTSLVQYLREQGTDFYYVGDSTFVPNPTPVSQPEEPTSRASSSNQTGMFVGVAVACVVAVALLGMLVARRHLGLLGGNGSGGRRMFDQELDSVNDSDGSKKAGDADTVNESYETDGSPARKGPSPNSPGFGGGAAGFESKQQIKQTQQQIMEQEHVYDADAGSVSDFTVRTEAGDTTALKTINAKQIMAVVPAMINSESFERERPVNLRKDMLTSAWSGRANAKRTSHNESVLQPSHFTASHERRVRRQEQDFDPDPSWNPEDDSVDVGSNASPFVFEQAHESPSVGEEIYLMPPSQTTIKRARTQSPVPEIL